MDTQFTAKTRLRSSEQNIVKTNRVCVEGLPSFFLPSLKFNNAVKPL